MKASIIVTSYNYANYVERCIRSCLDQSLPTEQYELIVVDDGSTDNTLSIIEKFKVAPNFRAMENRANVGVAQAANIGIRASVGQFVVRVDADDFVNNNFLLFLTTYLDANHDAFGVACDYIVVDEHEDIRERRYADRHPISCGIMYRKDLLTKVGLYDPNFRHLEEEELRQRVGDYYKIHYLHIPLYRYRMHNSNKTKRADEIAKARAALVRRAQDAPSHARMRKRDG